MFRRIDWKVKPWIVKLAFLLVLFAGVACEREKTPRYRIGVAQCSIDEWRDKMNSEMHREMLFHEDSYLEIASTNNSEKQIADIQSFIDRDFDLLIIAPNEAAPLTPVVKKAYEKGIPVVIFDRKINGDYYTIYIDLDNKGIGESAAEYAHSLFGNDKEVGVIEIRGLEGSSPAIERHEGFMEGLQKYTNLKLLTSVTANWDRDKAFSMADSLLKLYPETKLVYAHSDFMAIGISDGFRKQGRYDIKILGTDASPDQGIKAVEEGLIDATFIYPTEGHRIINTAFDILEGRPVEKVVEIPSLASVDKSNAEILLRQNELLKDETSKVLLLDDANERLQKRYRYLNRFTHSVVVLAIILFVVLGVVLFLFIKNRKLQKELKQQNRRLIEERDKQIELYHHLDTVLTKEDDFYNRFINIIRTEYPDSNLNTDILAHKMNLGAAQFTRKIKSLTNFTPIEILRNYRLEEARKLVLQSDKNINEITFAVGFSSAPYLTKCFREHFGMTPTELRMREMQKGKES